MQYPQYPTVTSRQGGGGGGWQSALASFFGCNTPDAPVRDAFPLAINSGSAGSSTGSGPEIYGSTEQNIETTPSRLVYFILPSNSVFEPQYIQPVLIPNYVENSARSNVLSPQITKTNAFSQPSVQVQSEKSD